jgi:hypothetical protein
VPHKGQCRVIYDLCTSASHLDRCRRRSMKSAGHCRAGPTRRLLSLDRRSYHPGCCRQRLSILLHPGSSQRLRTPGESCLGWGENLGMFGPYTTCRASTNSRHTFYFPECDRSLIRCLVSLLIGGSFLLSRGVFHGGGHSFKIQGARKIPPAPPPRSHVRVSFPYIGNGCPSSTEKGVLPLRLSTGT